MYTVGSVAGLISGKKAKNKVGVQLKTVEKNTKGKNAENTVKSGKVIKKKSKIASPIQNKKAQILTKSEEITEVIKPKSKQTTNVKAKKSNLKNISPVSKQATNGKAAKAEKFNLKNKLSESKQTTNGKTAKTEKSSFKNKLPKSKGAKPKLSESKGGKRKLSESKDQDSPILPKRQKLILDADKTLAISNVPVGVSEKALKKIFSKYGEIKSIRFRDIPVADPKTPKMVALNKKQFHPKRKSMSAFIVFQSNEEVKKALKANGTELNGHHLQVYIIGNKHDEKKSVFLGNLPYHAEEEDIRNLFESCGQIESVRVIRDNIGRCRGVSFINFESTDSVELALQMKDVQLYDRNLRIDRPSIALEKKKNKDAKKIKSGFELFVKNLPQEVNEKIIRKIFKSCGDILSVRFIHSKKQPIAYITFPHMDNIRKAIQLKPTLLGRKLIVSSPKSNKLQQAANIQFPNEKAIYVSNIPNQFDKTKLENLFTSCGKIAKTHIFRRSWIPTLACNIYFESSEAVDKALKMNNILIENVHLSITRKSSKKGKKDKIDENEKNNEGNVEEDDENEEEDSDEKDENNDEDDDKDEEDEDEESSNEIEAEESGSEVDAEESDDAENDDDDEDSEDI